MGVGTADIISKLQRDILSLQGLKSTVSNNPVDVGLGLIRHAFPNQTFPLCAIHEFINNNVEDASASGGFISGVLSALMKNGGASLWVSASRTVFPISLKAFGIDPAKIVFVDLKKEKDVLWAMEEALKCSGLAAVVGEIKNIDFTASRRLQLAVEQSGVTGFVIRNNPKHLHTIASVARWHITSLKSLTTDLPGVGFPRWNVELLKIRNGKPGSWQLEWRAGKFQEASEIIALPQIQKRKTGVA